MVRNQEKIEMNFEHEDLNSKGKENISKRLRKIPRVRYTMGDVFTNVFSTKTLCKSSTDESNMILPMIHFNQTIVEIRKPCSMHKTLAYLLSI
jgi:hypothetical protein